LQRFVSAMVEEFMLKTWHQLIGRVEGPFTFRFVLQPSVAVLLAVRSVTNGTRRRRDLRRLCIVAFTLDVLYQLLMLDRVYPLQAVLVVCALAVGPYTIARALARAIAGPTSTSG